MQAGHPSRKAFFPFFHSSLTCGLLQLSFRRTMSSFIAASLLLALPVFAVPKFDKLGAMEIVPRANYLGGWSQGRDGTGVGCPAASTACDGGPYGFLTLQCCPSGQTCFTTALTAYCCPTCKSAELQWCPEPTC